MDNAVVFTSALLKKRHAVCIYTAETRFPWEKEQRRGYALSIFQLGWRHVEWENASSLSLLGCDTNLNSKPSSSCLLYFDCGIFTRRAARLSLFSLPRPAAYGSRNSKIPFPPARSTKSCSFLASERENFRHTRTILSSRTQTNTRIPQSPFRQIAQRALFRFAKSEKKTSSWGLCVVFLLPSLRDGCDTCVNISFRVCVSTHLIPINWLLCALYAPTAPQTSA